jgi:hypothetical protein
MEMKMAESPSSPKLQQFWALVLFSAVLYSFGHVGKRASDRTIVGYIL